VDDQLDRTDLLWAALSDRYRLERQLAQGGMATVFLAEDLKHHRPVAIKVLKPGIAASLGSARFLREIGIASGLTHPHLLPLHDSGEAAGFLYYVMPYVEGETLRDRLTREKQLSVADSLRFAIDVTEGLEHAHRHGIIHRDIKPENILLQADRAIVADFGIARAVEASATEALTTSGVVVGTVTYMSPEQGCGDRELDARSDIYSLGCVLYEMLAGEAPFTGPSIQAIIARHAGEHVPSLRVVRPEIPRELEALVRKALAKAPADRFPTAQAFGAALRALESDRRPRRWLPRRRTVALAATIVVVIAGVLLAAKDVFSGGLREHDWLLVADFEGSSGDPQLAVAFRDLVTTALAQSRFVRTLERRQLNEVMRHAGVAETTHVDMNLGRQLALRSSVRAVLLGSIRPLGDGYSIVLHVVNAEDGNALASSAVTAHDPLRQSALVTAAEQSVRELRERLGEKRRAIASNRPLRDVATPSFAAFSKYSAAMDRVLIHGDVSGSNRLLAEAIGLDSGFASAWAMLGANYLTARQPDSARLAYSKALALPNRLSVAEEYRLKGDAAYAIERDVPAAVRWYDLYLAEMPQSRSGRNNRALYRSALGQYEEALADLEEAVALNPFGRELIQPTLLNQAAILVVLGRNEEAREVTKKLSGPFAEYMVIMTAMAESRWQAADSAAAIVIAGSTPPGVFRINAVTSRASALAARGAIRLADSVLREGAQGSRGSTARWYERARLLLKIASGSSVEARDDLLPRDTTPAAAVLRGLWSAVAGDSAAARQGLTVAGGMARRELAIVGAAPALIEGWIAFHANRPRDVVSRLERLAAIGEHDPTVLDRPDSFLLRWLVATAYQQLGWPDSAAMYLDLILKPSHMPPGHFALRGLPYGFAHLRLAALHEQRKDRKAAERHLDAFLAAFVDADSVTSPLVLEAQNTRARLRGTVAVQASPTQEGAR
jgi:tetratricopeptide (TPR) repeat protein